MQIKKPK